MPWELWRPSTGWRFSIIRRLTPSLEKFAGLAWKPGPYLGKTPELAKARDPLLTASPRVPRSRTLTTSSSPSTGIPRLCVAPSGCRPPSYTVQMVDHARADTHVPHVRTVLSDALRRQH